MIYQGGCALMLKVGIGDDYRFVNLLEPLCGTGWTILDPENYHLTLTFVGRNLPTDQIQRVVACAFDLEGPVDVRFTGKLDTFKTSKGRYVVALVEDDDSIMDKRNLFVTKLAEVGVVIRDAFSFKPHVSLAETGPKAVAPELFAVEPFTVTCHQLEVKYGPHRMMVDL